MFGNLEEEDTWFEMSEEQRSHFEDIRHFNSYLREEYHAINQLLWKSAHSFQPTGNSGFPQRLIIECQLSGLFHQAISDQLPIGL